MLAHLLAVLGSLLSLVKNAVFFCRLITSQHPLLFCVHFRRVQYKLFAAQVATATQLPLSVLCFRPPHALCCLWNSLLCLPRNHKYSTISILLFPPHSISNLILMNGLRPPQHPCPLAQLRLLAPYTLRPHSTHTITLLWSLPTTTSPTPSPNGLKSCRRLPVILRHCCHCHQQTFCPLLTSATSLNCPLLRHQLLGRLPPAAHATRGPSLPTLTALCAPLVLLLSPCLLLFSSFSRRALLFLSVFRRVLLPASALNSGACWLLFPPAPLAPTCSCAQTP